MLPNVSPVSRHYQLTSSHKHLSGQIGVEKEWFPVAPKRGIDPRVATSNVQKHPRIVPFTFCEAQ